MKRFARWLYMQTHRPELISVARQVHELNRAADKEKIDPIRGIKLCGQSIGMLDALLILNLLADS